MKLLFSLFVALGLLMRIEPCCADSREFIYFNDSRYSDLFATVEAVSHFLLYYEKGYCAGVEVDLQLSSLYGQSNWWAHFFEPICTGNFEDSLAIPTMIAYNYVIAPSIQDICKRERYHKVIKKYIRVTPSFKQKAQAFFDRNCKGVAAIGVHYYGYKKEMTYGIQKEIKKIRRVPYEHMTQEVRDYIKDSKMHDYKIFVSTNEQAFLDQMRLLFPNRIIHLPGRTSQDQKQRNLFRAEQDLIECLLLSKCNILIHTPTPVGIWASRFNPSLSLILVDGHKQLSYRPR